MGIKLDWSGAKEMAEGRRMDAIVPPYSYLDMQTVLHIQKSFLNKNKEKTMFNDCYGTFLKLTRDCYIDVHAIDCIKYEPVFACTVITLSSGKIIKTEKSPKKIVRMIEELKNV